MPLRNVVDYLARNAVPYAIIVFLLFFILCCFTVVSYFVSHIPETSLQSARKEDKPQHAQQPAKHDYKQIYLRYITDEVRLLPRLGLGINPNTPLVISLADIFIPLEFRLSPKPLKLQPISPDELECVSGLDEQHKYYLLVDEKGRWERDLLKGDRLAIAALWAYLSETQPAIVLQGDAGMGKSTLLARITLSLALQGQGQTDTQLSLTPTLMPILLQIKEYADYLQNPNLGSDRSLLTFLLHRLEEKMTSKGVEAARTVAEQIKNWLQARQCLVMFDGLDEVSDRTLQQEIQQAIHDFIQQQRRPHVQTPTWNRFLITSRIAEYDAPALESYRYFLVATLSLEQIRDFLPRWYQASIPTPGAEEQTRIKQLIAEFLNAYQRKDAVQKLAGNPLLLTLMAIMLHNGTSLPERRVELYQAVVRTLLETRNRMKDVKGAPELSEDEAIQRLGELAFTMQWKGNNLAHRPQVEAALQTAIANSPSSTSGQPTQVVQEANDYLSLISRRGGLFIERTAAYYGFLHRSFQEYFAARYILREIESHSDREKMIRNYVQTLRDNFDTWREPFILAVAFKSTGDGGRVATSMLRALLTYRRKNVLRDALLVATCITESQYINIEADLQNDTIERLLAYYEQAQKERRFSDCDKIEDVMRDWLLVLREKERYLTLPNKLLSAITNAKSPTRQRTALTLLCAIAGRSQNSRYNLFSFLIPALLALAGLEAVPDHPPDSNIPATTDLDIADLSLTLLSFMGSRGPGGLLLERTQRYFKDHPQLLRDLARYSLVSGTLITPIPVPVENEHFELYSKAIEKWIKLRDSYKPTHITTRNIEDCQSIQQTILDAAEEVRYPAALHLQAMLQRATSDPEHWRESWQSYLLEQLEQAPYVHYQQIVLLWTMLFPEQQDLKPLADRIMLHYNSTHPSQRRYSYRLLSTLSFDLIDLIVLIDLRYFRDLREFRGFRDFRDLGVFRFLGVFRDFRTLIDLIALRDLRDLGALIDLIDLRTLGALIDLIDFKNAAEKAKTALLSQGNGQAQDIASTDLLSILMGRILHIQEKGETGQQIEGEVQQFTTVALDYLAKRNVADSAYEAALDVVRSLPARTVNEICFIWQIVQKTQEPRISSACAEALVTAKPQDNAAWQELEQGKNSSVREISEAVERALQRRK